MSSDSPNRLLASLSSADFELLRPHLNAVTLVHEAVLFEPGDPIDRIHFPYSGIISLVVTLKGGQAVEAAMIGRDTVFGGSLAIGGLGSSNKVIVQLAGDGVTIDLGPISGDRREKSKSQNRTHPTRGGAARPSSAVRRLQCRPHNRGPAFQVAATGAGLVGQRQTCTDAGISRPDAGRATQQRFHRGEYAAASWAHPLQPRPNRNHEFGRSSGRLL